MRLTIKVNNEYITDDTKCMKNKYITKLGQLEDILEKYEIDSPEELSKILDDYDDAMGNVIALGAFLAKKGLVKEFREFVREGAKEK